jgi:hypothetical protein
MSRSIVEPTFVLVGLILAASSKPACYLALALYALWAVHLLEGVSCECKGNAYGTD